MNTSQAQGKFRQFSLLSLFEEIMQESICGYNYEVVFSGVGLFIQTLTKCSFKYYQEVV